MSIRKSVERLLREPHFETLCVQCTSYGNSPGRIIDHGSARDIEAPVVTSGYRGIASNNARNFKFPACQNRPN